MEIHERDCYRTYLENHKEEISRIYNSLADDKSKEIYKNLLLLQYTEEEKYLIDAIQLNGFEPDAALVQKEYLLQEGIEKGRNLILYGIGQIAREGFQLAESKRNAIGYLYLPFITDIPWSAYCDKNLAGTTVTVEDKEYCILSPLEFYEKYPDALVCVTSKEFFEEIKKELMNLGIQEKNIVLYQPPSTKVFEEEQYFDSQIMIPQKETYFVDAGCYRLDTVEKFIKWNGEKGIEGTISFEPDPVNHQICSKRLEELSLPPNVKKNCKVLHYGVGEKDDKMRFASYGTDESGFSENGVVEVRITSIDQVVKDLPVSFIKLDVEGFELPALRGAKKTICRCRPRMAVCAYHKKEDLIELPKFLLDLEMDYQLYIRMYSNEYLEIVIYAG